MAAPLDLSKISEIDRKDLIVLAQCAETGERYNDMCKFMNEVIMKLCKEGTKASTETRNMLSVAFKNVVGGKRQSIRALKDNLAQNDTALIKKYLKLVEGEVIDVCNQVLKVVTDGPLKLEEATKTSDENDADEDKESKVFWLKMCGDYCRYLSEIEDNDDAMVKLGAEKEKPAEKAAEFYEKAYKEAEQSLPETHPTRLGLALNYSVCFYEILKKKDKACELAKAAFDAAIEKLDTLNDKSYKDSTLIMQLLRDNLTLWTQDENADDNQ